MRRAKPAPLTKDDVAAILERAERPVFDGERAPNGRGVAGIKERAKAAAAAMGHVVSIIREDSPRRWIGRCDRCLAAAVTIRPEDEKPNPKTGDFFGGSAVSERCTKEEEQG